MSSIIGVIGRTPLVVAAAGVEGRLLTTAVLACESGLKYLNTDLY